MVDNYTKAVLTVIAIALSGIALKDTTIIPEAKAAYGDGDGNWAHIPATIWTRIGNREIAPPWSPCAMNVVGKIVCPDSSDN